MTDKAEPLITRQEAERITRIEAAAPEMLRFIHRWLDVIVGGDPITKLEPWVKDFYCEAKAIIVKVEGKP